MPPSMPSSRKRKNSGSNSHSSRITSEPPHIEGVPLPPKWMKRGAFVETGEKGRRGSLYRHPIVCKECKKRQLECLVPPLQPVPLAPGYFFCMTCEACSTSTTTPKCSHASREGDLGLRWDNNNKDGGFILDRLPKSVLDKRARARELAEKRKGPAFIDDSEDYCNRRDSSDYVDDGDESATSDESEDSDASDDSDHSEYIDNDRAPVRSSEHATRQVPQQPEKGTVRKGSRTVSHNPARSTCAPASIPSPVSRKSKPGAGGPVSRLVSSRQAQNTNNPVAVARPLLRKPEQGTGGSITRTVFRSILPKPEQRGPEPHPAPRRSEQRTTAQVTHPVPRQPQQETPSDGNCNKTTEVPQQQPQRQRKPASASVSDTSYSSVSSDLSDSDDESKIIVPRKHMKMRCRPSEFAARGAKRRRMYAPPSPTSPLEPPSEGAHITAQGRSTTDEVTHASEMTSAALATHANTVVTHAVTEVTSTMVEVMHNAAEAIHKTPETRTKPELETVKLEPKAFDVTANDMPTPQPTASPSPRASSPPSTTASIQHDDQVMLLEAEIEATRKERDAAIDQCRKVTEECNRLNKERDHFLKMHDNLIKMYQDSLH